MFDYGESFTLLIDFKSRLRDIVLLDVKNSNTYTITNTILCILNLFLNPNALFLYLAVGWDKECKFKRARSLAPI